MNKNSTFYFLLTSFFVTCTIFLHAQEPIPGGCGTVGPNLVVNPDFEDGNTGFTNSFTFVDGITCFYGDYTIASTVVNDPTTTCYDFPGFNLQDIWRVSDRINQGGGPYVPGKFMIVDPCSANGGPDSCSTSDLSGIIWEQDVTVCPNNSYAFSVFVKNIYFQEAFSYPGSDTEPDFELTINGDTVSGYYVDGVLSNSGSFSLPKMPEADSAKWFQISGAWNSGTNTSANLVMKNLVPGQEGNDLALDAVFFGLCGKEVEALVSGSLCQDANAPSPLTFTPSPPTQNSAWLYYEWYKDGQLVQGDANGTFTPALDPVTGYLGEYSLIAYEDPAGVTCGHSSATISVIEDTSPDCPTVFPVEMLSFDGEQVGQKIALNWATSLEINNRGFEVEMSRDGEEFSVIGFVGGHGSSSQISTYDFTTATLTSGAYVFRLKQIDFDGSFNFSGNIELSVDLQNDFLFSLAPNPINQGAKLVLEVQEKQMVNIELLSTDGKIAQKIFSNRVEIEQALELNITTDQLAEGIYFLRIQGATFSHFEKVVIAK